MFSTKIAFAADDASISTLSNPATKLAGITDLGGLLTKGGVNILDLIFLVVGLAFFANLVLAGWDYMMSSGDPKKVSAASSRLTNGLIGLIMSITAFLVVRTVTTIIGIPNIF